MASVAVMVGGAILNAAAFIGGNKLFKGDSDEKAQREAERHNRATEEYQAAYAKYERDRDKLFDWMRTNERMKDDAKQDFTNTDFALKLYNKMHPEERMEPP